MALIDELFALEGRVAVVTGASSGIGRQMAGTLARAGARVVAVARRRQALEEFVAAQRIDGAGALAALNADLASLSDFTGIAGEAAARFGPPDILINAAGVNPRAPADSIDLATWTDTLTLNLTVPMFLAQALMPGMREKGGGNIINIASLQSSRAFANGIAYGATKGGIAQLTRAMAEAWGRYGIVANAIAPGFFPTELTASVFADAELADRHARATCLGRNGAMDDLDGATVFLASRGARYVTGQILAVDGGYTAK